MQQDDDSDILVPSLGLLMPQNSLSTAFVRDDKGVLYSGKRSKDCRQPAAIHELP
jgi:hypothetical protein